MLGVKRRPKTGDDPYPHAAKLITTVTFSGYRLLAVPPLYAVSRLLFGSARLQLGFFCPPSAIRLPPYSFLPT